MDESLDRRCPPPRRASLEPAYVPPPRHRVATRVWLHVAAVPADRGHDDARRRRCTTSRFTTGFGGAERGSPRRIFSEPGVLPARPLVQRARCWRFSAATRWATTSRAAVTAWTPRCPSSCPAPLPLTGHARRVHPDPPADSVEGRAVRHRRSPGRSPASSSRCRRCSSGWRCR